MNSTTDISRDYHWGVSVERDNLIKSMQWNGPKFDHNFYKCWSKKDERIKESLKENKRTPQNLKDS